MVVGGVVLVGDLVEGLLWLLGRSSGVVVCVIVCVCGIVVIVC